MSELDNLTTHNASGPSPRFRRRVARPVRRLAVAVALALAALPVGAAQAGSTSDTWAHLVANDVKWKKGKCANTYIYVRPTGGDDTFDGFLRVYDPDRVRIYADFVDGRQAFRFPLCAGEDLQGKYRVELEYTYDGFSGIEEGTLSTTFRYSRRAF